MVSGILLRSTFHCAAQRTVEVLNTHSNSCYREICTCTVHILNNRLLAMATKPLSTISSFRYIIMNWALCQTSRHTTNVSMELLGLSQKNKKTKSAHPRNVIAFAPILLSYRPKVVDTGAQIVYCQVSSANFFNERIVENNRWYMTIHNLSASID